MANPVLALEIFDRLRQATGANPAVLEELCRDYIAEARGAMSQMANAIAEQNAAELRERAHYIKGASMMIGARQLSHCCATLEAMGRDSELSEAAAALGQASAALKAVETELTKELGPAALPADGSAAQLEGHSSE